MKMNMNVIMLLLVILLNSSVECNKTQQKNRLRISQQQQEAPKESSIEGDLTKKIMDEQIVVAKMDVAISLSSKNQDAKKVHCLCDFTIVKKQEKTLGESECEFLPDTIEQIEGEKKIETCVTHCNKQLNEKLKGDDVKKC